MRVREKLNVAATAACVAAAGLLGAALESWVASCGLLFLLVVGCHHAGAIRPQPEARSPAPRPEGGRPRTRRPGRRA